MSQREEGNTKLAANDVNCHCCINHSGLYILLCT